MLHTSKFKEIVRLVIEGSDNFEKELVEILQGHRLQGIMENLEIDELADFCRHVAVANKSMVGWEFVDELTYALEKKYTPRWELPDLEYDTGFREVFLGRITWEPSETIRQLIKKFLNTYEEHVGEKLDLGHSFKIETQKIWSFKDIYLILNELSYLIGNYKGKIDIKQFEPLQNQLEEVMMEHYRNKVYSVEQRAALLFLTINGTLNKTDEDFAQVQILMDNAYNLIKQFEEAHFESYRWIFGYTYAYFSSYLFNSTSDLVIRRDLVAELIQDFYKPEDVDLDFWSKHLSRSKPHPLLMAIIIRGYQEITKMVYDHAMDLPTSENQQQLLGYHRNLVKFIEDTIYTYLEAYYKIKRDIGPDEIYEQIYKKIKFTNVRRDFLNSLIFSTKWTMIVEKNEDPRKIDLLRILSERHVSPAFAKMQVIDTKLLLGSFDFDNIVKVIKDETMNADSIILSEKFEDEVISVIGELFGEVQEEFKNRDDTDIDSYEIVLLYTYMWLYHFANYPELKYEGMMMLSPIISICYIQIARGYYERNNLEAAYLTYFNNHFLIEFVNTEIASHMTTSQTTQSKLIEKFSTVIKEWDIDFVVKEDYIKKITSNIDVKIKNRVKERENKTFSMTGMLQDEVVIGYLDMVADLEEFLAQVPEKIDHNFINVILSSNLYTEPVKESVFRKEFMGMVNTSLPFPIIRNINAYAMAIKLYPIDVELPGTINFASFLQETING